MSFTAVGLDMIEPMKTSFIRACLELHGLSFQSLDVRWLVSFRRIEEQGASGQVEFPVINRNRPAPSILSRE